MRTRLILIAGVLAAAGCVTAPSTAPLAVAASASSPAAAAEPLNIYFELLHAHTRFSDGSGTPADAFAMARDAGLQFFAVTEHNHAAAEDGAKERTDGLLIALDPRLYNSEDALEIETPDGPVQTVSLLRAAREANSASFLALYGQEFSTISSGNHVNVLLYPRVLTDPNGDYASLYGTLQEHAQSAPEPAVVQLNHPDVHADLFYAGQDEKTRKKMFNDYGLDDFGGSFAALVAATDRHVDLIELLSGPAMTMRPKQQYHYKDHEDDYYFYLVQGFHISPSAGQDNHYPTWGIMTPARMGVLAPQLTQEAVLAAMRANRTFATEDNDLHVRLLVNGSMMGECLDLAAGAELNVEVAVEDAGEPAAEYEVTLVWGRVAPQTRQTLTKVVPADGELETLDLTGSGRVSFEGQTALGEPEFLYARVKQGDGDRAWTAPIWLNHPRAAAEAAPAWVWTKNASTVYHHPWCTTAAKITSANRMSGPTPPADRRLHDCRRPETGPGH